MVEAFSRRMDSSTYARRAGPSPADAAGGLPLPFTATTSPSSPSGLTRVSFILSPALRCAWSAAKANQPCGQGGDNVCATPDLLVHSRGITLWISRHCAPQTGAELQVRDPPGVDPRKFRA